MDPLLWTPLDSVGIEAFDDDHRRLFATVARLVVAMEDTDEPSLDVRGAVADLVSYTRDHFAAEEALLERHGFPGLGAHRAEHADFARRVRDLQDRLAGEQAWNLELVFALADWLSRHVRGSDRQYARFLLARGAR